MADEKQASPTRSREAIRNFMLDIDPAAVESAVRDDADLARAITVGRFNLLMSVAALSAALSDYVSGLPEEDRRELLTEVMSGLDGARLAESMNSVSVLLLKMRDEKAQLDEPIAVAIGAFMENADFGKTREAFEWWTKLVTSMTCGAIDLMMENPVLTANIVGMLPPLANTLIRVFAKFVDSMDLPAEILASALFNIIEELDAEEIGRGLTAVARQVNSLHEGNKVLGGEEPRFRAVFSGFMSRMLDETDPAQVAAMLVAIAEDVETMAGVLSGIAARDDEMMLTFARTGAQLTEVIARTLTGMFIEMGKVPPATLERIGSEMLDSMDPSEIGRAVNAWVDLGLAFREASPDFDTLFLERVFSRLDFERLELLFAGSMVDVARAARSSPALMRSLEPEQVGRRVNDALRAFNSSVSSAAAVRDYIARVMSAIDTRELSDATSKLAKGLTEGMLANAEKGEVILKSSMSAAWSVARFVFGRITDKLRSLTAGR